MPAKTDAPKQTDADRPADASGQVKKPEFVDRVVTRSGLKKRDVKPAVEAALAELAAVLASGDELVLPPVGKLRLVKSKDLGEGAQVMTIKLRTMKDGAGQGKTGLAEPDGAD